MGFQNAFSTTGDGEMQQKYRVRRAKQTRCVQSFHSLPGGTSALAACTQPSLSLYLPAAADVDTWQPELHLCEWRQEDLQGTLVKIRTHANISPHISTAAVLRAAPTSWASLRRDQILLKLTILLKLYAKFKHCLSGAISYMPACIDAVKQRKQ